jgi:uncharacterized protein YjbI with pentapeptide repeats
VVIHIATVAQSSSTGARIEIAIAGAAIGAVAILIVGLLNFLAQRRLIDQQRDLIERQLTAQREQSERQLANQGELLDRQLTQQREFADRQLMENRQQLELTREGQIVDRFTRVIDQLGDDKVEVRLGAIYALERIAVKSDDDRASIIEIFTAFVRASPAPSDVDQALHLRVRTADVQAVMTVLGRLALSTDRLEFGSVDLSRAYLGQAQFEGANLAGANLDGADLSGAGLIGADLTGARLDGANLSRAVLNSAQLERSTLRRTVLWKADLRKANLSHADLRGTVFKAAKLHGTSLTGATFDEETELTDARANSMTTFPQGFGGRHAQARGVIFEP